MFVKYFAACLDKTESSLYFRENWKLRYNFAFGFRGELNRALDALLPLGGVDSVL